MEKNKIINRIALILSGAWSATKNDKYADGAWCDVISKDGHKPDFQMLASRLVSSGIILEKEWSYEKYRAAISGLDSNQKESKQKGEDMRDYEIGDRVLWGKDKAIICGYNKEKDRYLVGNVYDGDDGDCNCDNIYSLAFNCDIEPDLHNINKPFGLCGKAVREALEKLNNYQLGENSKIEMLYNNNIWLKVSPNFNADIESVRVFRLAEPNEDKNILIDGKEFSESTIKAALRDYLS